MPTYRRMAAMVATIAAAAPRKVTGAVADANATFTLFFACRFMALTWSAGAAAIFAVQKASENVAVSRGEGIGELNAVIGVGPAWPRTGT